MSFGYRDSEWVDPPIIEEGKPDGCTCADCKHLRPHPQSTISWCFKVKEYVDELDDDDCDYFVLKL